MTLDPARLRDFASRYTAAWCSQDPASVAAFFSPNGALKVNRVPAVGRDAITEVARGFMSAFPDMVLTMGDLLFEGDHATYHWTLDGHNTGPGGTGKRVLTSGYEEWTFAEDGLIAESQGHFDETEYQRQLKFGFGETQH
jgi:predicted ester cyclase